MASGVKGLDAVVLIVDRFEETKTFYRDHLGMEVFDEYEDAVFFKCGAQTLALFGRTHHPEGTKRLEGARKGISHLEFRIEKSARKKTELDLRKAGRHAYGDNYEDPDGNLFHFNDTK